MKAYKGGFAPGEKIIFFKRQGKAPNFFTVNRFAPSALRIASETFIVKPFDEAAFSVILYALSKQVMAKDLKYAEREIAMDKLASVKNKLVIPYLAKITEMDDTFFLDLAMSALPKFDDDEALAALENGVVSRNRGFSQQKAASCLRESVHPDTEINFVRSD